MIRNLGIASSFIALSFVALAGCTAEVRAAPPPPPPPPAVEAEVVVEPPAPPPPAEVEVVPASPGAEFFWIGGYHRWYGGRYVWVRGHYDRRPYAGARWEGPRWEARGRGRVWVEGRWR
jgi:hypothetical protein